MPASLKPYFDKDSSKYCGNGFGHYFKTTAKLFQFLPEAIKEDKQQWHRVFPEKGDEVDPFDGVYASEEETRVFLESMWGLGYPGSKELLQKFGVEKFNHLVDLGGATGSFVISALEQNSKMTGEVFDFELVKPFFEEKRDTHGLNDRLEFTVGDIFKDEFPEADLFSMGYILSDWSREKGTFLLKKIYDKLPPGGAVIVLEKLFNDQKDGPVPTAMMNLVMLLEMEGTHYNVSEYQKWLSEIGFVDVAAYFSSGEKHMVIAYKPK
jgi:hypothetical protein